MGGIRGQALTEKAREAERRVGLLRVLVIAIGTVSYGFLLSHEGTHPILAYSVLAFAWAYSVTVFLFRPYLRFPVLASSLYTTLTDSILLLSWLAATGGFASPYWAIMFLSILAIAYRYSLRPAVLAWAIYCGLYVGMVVAMGQWQGNEGVLFIRVTYLGVGTAVAGLISTQSLEQVQARLAISQVAETERRLRDEATRSLSLLGATLQSTADGILVVDAEGRITNSNRRFGELWRIPQEVLDGGRDEDAIRYVLDQLKDPDGFQRKVKELYGQPLAESFDTLEFLDGRTFERYSRPLLVAGKPQGRVWSFRDVSVRVRAERERQANRERAEELTRLKEVDAFKSQFINTAAHELNTPLTPILLQLHLLENRMGGSDAQEGLQVLRRNVQRLADLVADLLDSAKYQAGRLLLRLEPTDIPSLVEECMETFADAAAAKGVQWVGRMQAVQASIDRRRVSQVLYNLLSNALKFTPTGGKVKVVVESSSDSFTVRVQDTGAGIPPEKVHKLFLPFSQVHADTHAGTGLGLYISRGIVEAHQGRIWCESAGPEQGTTFAFTLPLQAVATPPSMHPAAA